jgi:multimeric flavodoxin WrbA
MNDLFLIIPEKPSFMLEKMIQAVIQDRDPVIINDESHVSSLRQGKIIFALEVNNIGFSNNLSNIFSKLYSMGNSSLFGFQGIVLTHSNTELYTRSAAQNIIFHGNQLGLRFIGRPLVEATGNLENFIPMKSIYNDSLENICLNSCYELGQRFFKDNISPIKNPKILIIYSSNWRTSNSLLLWNMVKRNLNSCKIREIHIGNGTIYDCKGCPYKTCKHYGQQVSCFYGGIIVEEVYPALLQSNAVVFICPNYNDSVSANIMAVINRLTALFRRTKFYDKTLFSIIVSGYSGNDIVAKQIISSLNLNKTFRLPPYFSLMATANNKDSIKDVPNIEEKAKCFAENIMREIKK